MAVTDTKKYKTEPFALRKQPVYLGIKKHAVEKLYKI